jgi:hypothetical protein
MSFVRRVRHGTEARRTDARDLERRIRSVPTADFAGPQKTRSMRPVEQFLVCRLQPRYVPDVCSVLERNGTGRRKPTVGNVQITGNGQRAEVSRGMPLYRRNQRLADRTETKTETTGGIMSKSIGALSALVAAMGVSLGQPVLAHGVDENLGKVHFETSCTPAAAAAFDQGMLYQHSFWYSASQRSFNEALQADPTCGIAYWGIALSLLWNPHAAPPAKNLAEGAATIAKGREVGAKTERERDYLAALSAML